VGLSEGILTSDGGRKAMTIGDKDKAVRTMLESLRSELRLSLPGINGDLEAEERKLWSAAEQYKPAKFRQQLEELERLFADQ
jgi:hypothetical protein